jgi:hypothetical protein
MMTSSLFQTNSASSVPRMSGASAELASAATIKPSSASTSVGTVKFLFFQGITLHEQAHARA